MDVSGQLRLETKLFSLKAAQRAGGRTERLQKETLTSSSKTVLDRLQSGVEVS